MGGEGDIGLASGRSALLSGDEGVARTATLRPLQAKSNERPTNSVTS